MSFIASLGDWLRKVTRSFASASISGQNITLTRHNGDTVVLTTADTTYSNATQSTAGLMSKDDKKKLDEIADKAEVNQNAFSNVKVGSTTIAADAKTDTLELAAGTGITLTPDATNDTVTIKVTDNTYASASHTHSYLPLSGGTLTGALTFANNTWNTVGDDVKIGDFNKAGLLGVMGANGTTGIALCKQGDATVYKTISSDGTDLTMNGRLIVPAVLSHAAGNVKTKATGGYTGLVIKDASGSADSTPNNGMVIEVYKNNANYAGQLFLGDNAMQGLYWNGWSGGTYGVWKKFIMTSDATYTVGSAAQPVYVNNGAVAACTSEFDIVTAKSIASVSGYIKYKSGLILQWGQAAFDGTHTYRQFAMPQPCTILQAFACDLITGSATVTSANITSGISWVKGLNSTTEIRFATTAAAAPSMDAFSYFIIGKAI